MNHIFISYSKKDIVFARYLRGLLEAENFRVWMDEREIHPSDDWWEIIEQNIISCSAFIVIMSSHSKTSKWVMRELLIAEDPEYSRRIYPVLLEGKRWSRLAEMQYEDMSAGIESKISPNFINSLRKDALTTSKHILQSASKESTLSQEFPIQTPKTSIDKIANSLTNRRLQLWKGDDLEDPFLKPKVLMPEPFAWCEIPSGRITSNGTTQYLQEFKIAKYPVTNAQFRVFLDDANGYNNPQWWDFSKSSEIWKKSNATVQVLPKELGRNKQPRINITWYEAMAFCRWLGMTSNKKITLPTEAQWQFAAQGEKGFKYPWGEALDTNRCNTSESIFHRTTTVDHYPNGASAFGVIDMSGNVWEWSLDMKEGENSKEVYVSKGGAWSFSPELADVTRFWNFWANYSSTFIGFRPVIL